MKGAEPEKDAAFHEPETVVAPIAVEVCVEAGDDGNAHPAGDTESAPAEGAFGGHVDTVRGMFCPEPAEGPVGGKAEAEFRIAWNGDARDGVEKMRFLWAGGAVWASGGDNGDLDPALVEAVDQAPEGHGDPVYFGRKGFSDQ